MRTVLLLIGFLLTAIHAIGQECYPQKVVINNDTLVAFTQEQSDDLLQIYLQRNQVIEEAVIKDSLITTYTARISQQDSTIVETLSLVKESQANLVSLQSVVSNKEVEIYTLQKQLKKQKTRNSIKIVSTYATVVAGVSAYLLLKK